MTVAVHRTAPERAGTALHQSLRTACPFGIVDPQTPRIAAWRWDEADRRYRAAGLGDDTAPPERDGTFAVHDVYAGIPFDHA